MIIVNLFSMTFFLACQAAISTKPIRRANQAGGEDFSPLVVSILQNPEFQKSINDALIQIAEGRRIADGNADNAGANAVDVGLKDSKESPDLPIEAPAGVANQALPLYPPQGYVDGKYNDNPVMNVAQAGEYSILTSQYLTTLYNGGGSDTAAGGVATDAGMVGNGGYQGLQGTSGSPGGEFATPTSDASYGGYGGAASTDTNAAEGGTGGVATNSEYGAVGGNEYGTLYGTETGPYNTGAATGPVTGAYTGVATGAYTGAVNGGTANTVTELATGISTATGFGAGTGSTTATVTTSSAKATSTVTSSASPQAAETITSTSPPQSNGQKKLEVGAILGLMVAFTMGMFVD